MTSKTKYLAFAALAAMLAGCSNEEDFPPQQKDVLPEDGVIRVETSVNDIRSRAIGYATNGLTEFGLFVTNTNSDTYTYSNVKMKKDAKTWTSYKSDGSTPWMMLWQSESATVNVTAYAPYNADAKSGGTLTGNVEENQTDEEKGKLSDALYANADVTPNASNTGDDIYYDADPKCRKLKVKMNHVMSKLTVNIRYGTELTQNGTPVPTSVSLGETKTGYSFDLSKGAVTATGNTGSIKMAKADDTAKDYDQSYEAILVPQDAAFNVVVILGEKNDRYVYSHSGFGFEGGNAYTLNLVVGKDITNIGNITAKAWEPGASGLIETK